MFSWLMTLNGKKKIFQKKISKGENCKEKKIEFGNYKVEISLKGTKKKRRKETNQKSSETRGWKAVRKSIRGFNLFIKNTNEYWQWTPHPRSGLFFFLTNYNCLSELHKPHLSMLSVITYTLGYFSFWQWTSVCAIYSTGTFPYALVVAIGTE